MEGQMTNTRGSILAAIEAHPGIHFSGLVHNLNLAPGQVQYHLRQLQAKNRVVRDHYHGQTHYYPPAFDEWERRALAILRRETAGDIVAHLLEEGQTPPGVIASELDIVRSTMEWHLDRLVDQGLVEKQRKNGRIVLLAAPPRDTVRLLRDADPKLGDRLVDRFTRIVDRFLLD